MTFWDTVLAIVLHTKKFLNKYNFPLRVVVDAYFANSSFIQPLIDMEVHCITRWRKNGVAMDDNIKPYSGRGRPPKKGKEWKLTNLLNAFPIQTIKVKIYDKSVQLNVVVKDMWFRNISQKLRVVVIENGHTPIILVSTDLTLTAKQIIEIYSSRFSLEITIRDLKQHFGFGDYQTTTTLSILRFVRLSCVSLCLWRLTMIPETTSKYLCSKKMKIEDKLVISFKTLRQELKKFVMSKVLFPNSATSTELQKIKIQYDPIFRVAI